MIITYTMFSQSLKAKLQKRNRNGRFAKPIPTGNQVKKNPLVTFSYPSSETGVDRMRFVRLISATPHYLVGLEITASAPGKPRYQFKKFYQPKVSNFRLVEFNPSSMS